MNNILLYLLEINEEFANYVLLKTLSFPGRSEILTENTNYTKILIVKSGKVGIYSKSKKQFEGKTIQAELIELGPGEIFGEFGLFDDGPASATVITLENTELYEIDKPKLREYLEQNSDVGYVVIKYLYETLIERIRHTNLSVNQLLNWALLANKAGSGPDA